ncbi:FeoA family protein [Desulforamulus aquiferis]|uniref:FeoA family protein n=1 Tax=Desulforamulus aquiferis TaxID=1397668 RepID=A0AAW7ZE86_9FIRM|nr:FeoA family protein [Desulforamulus aquiferis]MDO7787569.1 FeoA family protein [Desulforamulus aquiferis]RYD01555.1 iron transporter FeoA [Desulforamulus aquiferis]
MIKPLSFIKQGRVVTIQDIAGCPQRKRHLEEMGFIPGTPLEVCRCCQQGPLVVAIRGGKVMLGEEMAKDIMVRP